MESGIPSVIVTYGKCSFSWFI